jgi:cell division protein FtsB
MAIEMHMFSDTWGRLRQNFWPLLCVLAILYFAWHTIQGRHGLRAYMEYGSRLGSLEAQAASTRATREQLENQRRLLQSRAVDPDYLDELARKKLNYMTEDEKVVDLPAQPKR